MTGGYVLGGVSALLAFWILMSALEGLGYAVPVRPSVIVPERWAVGAQTLLWVILFGIVASFLVPMVLGETPRLTFFHLLILLAVVLPIWEIVAARMYGDSFVVLNGRQEIVRPIVIATVGRVFGEVFEEKDMLYSVIKRGEDWQLIPHDRQHLLVLDPTFSVDMKRRLALEKALSAALKGIKPAGFNERSFWISFFLPLWFVAVYAGIAYYLLHPLTLPVLHLSHGG